MSRPLGIRNHDPLRLEHLVLSLHKQAQIIGEMRNGAKQRVARELLPMMREARDILSKILETER